MLRRAPGRICFPVLYLLPLGVALAGIGLAGCGRGAHAETAPKAKANEPPVLQAAVLMIEPTTWPATVRTQGSLAADEVTIVGAKVAGRVSDLSFDLGDAVKGHTVLATLDQDDFRLQVSLADAQLTQSRAALGLKPDDPVESLDPQTAPPVREAKAVWDETRARVARVRQLQLHTRNTVTQEEYDQAVAAEASAEARHAAAINGVGEKIAQINVRASELNVAKQHLSDTVIHAPFDGLVQERHVAHGSFVQIGDPIVTLVRTSVVRFHGTVPERHAHRLALGQAVRLKIEGFSLARTATVTRISPTVEEMSRSLAFEAQVDNRDGLLRTGLFAEAEVVVDPAAQSLVVPQAAILEFAGAEKVWKLVAGVAKEQIVQTARHGEHGVEIVGGLKPGDLILADAVKGRVARIDPIYQPAAAVNELPGGESAEASAGEEIESAAGASVPAAATPTHAVSR
jgi:RND family efflux transporter MFP subunit